VNVIYAIDGYANFISWILRIQGSFLHSPHVSQTALVANTIVSMPRALLRTRSLSDFLWYFDILIRTRIKRIGIRCERYASPRYPQRRHANASHAILVRAVSEASGFSRTRIILGCALGPSQVVFRVKRIHAIETKSRRYGVVAGGEIESNLKSLSLRLAWDNDPGDRLAYTILRRWSPRSHSVTCTRFCRQADGFSEIVAASSSTSKLNARDEWRGEIHLPFARHRQWP